MKAVERLLSEDTVVKAYITASFTSYLDLLVRLPSQAILSHYHVLERIAFLEILILHRSQVTLRFILRLALCEIQIGLLEGAEWLAIRNT